MALEVEKTPTAATYHGGADESADEALRAFAGMDPGERDVLVVDAATNRRLLRRIDLFIMPVSNDNFALFIRCQPKKKKKREKEKNESSFGWETDEWDQWD